MKQSKPLRHQYLLLLLVIGTEQREVGKWNLEINAEGKIRQRR
jgi:hypothetical protein